MDLGAAFLNPVEQDQRISINADKEAREKELAPAKLAHEIAQGRLVTQQANALEQSVNSNRAAAAAMLAQLGGAKADPNAPAPPVSEQLKNTATIWAAAGDPVKAEKALAEASTAAGHEATERNSLRAAKTAELTQRMKLGETLSNLAGGITDQASMDAANVAYEKMTGQKSPFAGVAYNAGMVKAVADSGLKMKDRAQLKLNEDKLESLKERREEQERHDRAVEGIAQARLQATRERQASVKKVGGGKDVGSPSGPEQKAAKALLGDLVDAVDMDAAAYDVASQARVFRKANPGISADDALRSAIEAKRVAGDFSTTTTPPKTVFGVDIPFTGGDPKKAYAVKAVPLPASKNPKDLKMGQAYSAGGKVMIWNGKGWVAPAPAAAPARGRAAPDPEDDEDDEDDED